ncbi:MAG: GNAT family N-acetyltransferase [Elusimicrobia bacterium]|nr:GNAT family N-acetyltransferase [Elusimicrobiota bacterium]
MSAIDDRLMLRDPRGRVVGELSFFPAQKGVYYAVAPRSQRADDLLDLEDFRGVLMAVAARCARLGARSVRVRLVFGPQGRELAGILTALGWGKLLERVEFSALLADLPDERGGPLTWTPISPTGPVDLSQAAILLGQAAQGDPDWLAEDDPCQVLEAWLAERELYAAPDAVQIGLLEGRPAAVVVAQANPKTGWSRITYMGVLPGFRGRGLGAWIQRRGFSMLRAQGGREYHGGTASTNAPMLRLFGAHGCRERRRMEEWMLARFS